MDIHKIAQELYEALKLPGLSSLTPLERKPLLSFLTASTGFITLIRTSKKEKYLADLEDIPGDNILPKEILIFFSGKTDIK